MYALSKIIVLVVVSLSVSAFAQSPDDEIVGLGGERQFIMKNVNRAAIDDPTIATITVDGDSVKLVAKKVGRSMMHIWNQNNAEPDTFAVVVIAQPDEQLPLAPPARHIGRPLRDNESIAVGEALLRTSSDVMRVAIGNPKIANVSLDQSGLSVIGVSTGKTTLLIWLKNGSRQQFHLTVR